MTISDDSFPFLPAAAAAAAPMATAQRAPKKFRGQNMQNAESSETLLGKLTFYHVSQTLANMPANIG